MDRRSFLKTTTAAAATATAVATATAATPLPLPGAGPAADAGDLAPASPAIVSGVRELSMAMPWRDRVSGPADHAHRLARRLDIALDGRWRITPHYHAHGGLEAVMTATSDLYIGTENDNLSFHPAFAYFAGLPGAGVLNAHDLVAWLKVGGGQECWDELAAPFNVKPLLVGHLGRWPGLWTRMPIDSLADLADQPVALQGLARDVMRGLGARPVPVPADDLAAAMTAGEIVAAEFGGPLVSHAIGLPAAASHLHGFGILEGGIGLSLGIRKSLWDRLGQADQAVVAAVAADEAQTTIAEMRAHDHGLRSLFRSHFGIAFSPLPADVAIAAERVAEAVVADTGSIDRLARRINDSYHSFRDAAWGIQDHRGPPSTS